MVDSLLHPLNIFIVGLGGGFLIPMFYRLGRFVGRDCLCSGTHGDDDYFRLRAVHALGGCLID